MSERRLTRVWHVEGMTCAGCEAKIEKKLAALGVERADASYRAGRVKAAFDPGRVSPEDIERALGKLGYPAAAETSSASGAAETKSSSGPARGLLIAAGLLAFFFVGSRFGLFAFFNAFPEAKEGMGIGMLFVVGLLTSVHCVAMCGGINLSQTVGKSSGGARALRPSILYNLGRVISYTVVGFAVGALGSVVKLSAGVQAAVQLIAGAFMVIMGLNLMNAFPWLRRLTPSMPKFLSRKIAGKREKSNSALYVGLLNGLMPCGPLQAMQLYALSTGSPVKGALAMLMFSLGTVPLMFVLGALGSALSRRSAGRMIAVGAALVAVMGVAMLGNGLGLAGVSIPVSAPRGSVAYASAPEPAAPVAPDEDGVVPPAKENVQIVKTELSPYGYTPISVRAGVPVKWTIHAEPNALNGCNNRILVREYGIEKALSAGDNLIEFTPEKAGTFAYTCWMGMIRSSITVVDGPVDQAALPAAEALPPLDVGRLPGCSCCR